MSKLLSRSLKRFVVYAAVVLACSIPVYYFILSELWRYEMAEHNIALSPEAGREDSFLIIGTVTALTVLFFCLLLAGLVFLNRRSSRKLWHPFYDSLHKIRGFDLSSQQSIRFEQTDIAEFAELNEQLNKLIAGATKAYNQQKEFADNASHELQTPLAIIQSKLDLLLQSQSLITEQYNIIEDAHKALTRVGRINKNLLLLTRIDNSQYMDEEVIDFTALVQNTIELFSGFATTKQILLENDLTDAVTISGNKELVGILLNNLLNNAIQHSPAGSTVHIKLSGQALVLSNKGSAPLNPQQLFKRFGVAQSGSPGTGLGLALAKQIADRYQWRLTYAFDQDCHIFSLHF